MYNQYYIYVQPIYIILIVLALLYNNYMYAVVITCIQLETEEPLLIPHAKAALDKYHHQVNALAVTSIYI